MTGGKGAGILLACCLPGLAACGGKDFGPASLQGANVLLVTLDTTRADALGRPEGITPHLDALAGRSVSFTQAHTVAPITLPAHASVLTGRFPFEHGVRDNGTFLLPEEARTLAEVLQEAGWSTAAVMGALVLHQDHGLAQGFDVYSDVPQRMIAGREEERSAEEVVDEALRVLASLPEDRPFFLWVHLFDPHMPYQPPRQHLESMPEAVRYRVDLPPLERARRLYLAEVSYMDHHVGRLLDAMEARGGPDHVLTAVVGDHGESLGEHGEDTHSFLVHETTIRVPFLLSHRLLAARAIDTPVSVVDLAPTVLSLVGVEPPAGMSGADLAAALRAGDPTLPPASRPLYFETAASWHTYGWSPLYGLVQGPWKVILGPEPRLYAWQEDPKEEQDRAAEHPEILEQARGALAVLASRTTRAARRTLSDEEQASLEALGYVMGSEPAGEDQLLLPGWIPEDRMGPEQGLAGMERFRQASTRWEQGERNTALLEEFLDVVRQDPTNPVYLGHVGSHLVDVGRFPEALALLRRSVELRGDSSARHSLGVCLLRMQRFREAEGALEENVLRNPSYLPSRLTLGQLLLQRGKAARAVEHLEFFLRNLERDTPQKEAARRLLEQARAAAR